MKKFIKNNLIGIITGIIISGTVGVIAATTISSKNVTYQNKTVNTALDELYNEATTGKELVAAAITNKGITTTSNDTYETMAANINSIDTNFDAKIDLLWENPNPNVEQGTGIIFTLSDYDKYRYFIIETKFAYNIDVKPHTKTIIPNTTQVYGVSATLGGGNNYTWKGISYDKGVFNCTKLEDTRFSIITHIYGIL